MAADCSRGAVARCPGLGGARWPAGPPGLAGAASGACAVGSHSCALLPHDVGSPPIVHTCRKIPGVGRVTEHVVRNALNVTRCGELVAACGLMCALLTRTQACAGRCACWPALRLPAPIPACRVSACPPWSPVPSPPGYLPSLTASTLGAALPAGGVPAALSPRAGPDPACGGASRGGGGPQGHQLRADFQVRSLSSWHGWV